MAKVTITFTAVSTLVLLVAFGQGMGVLHGSDVGSHLRWAVAALLTTLTANLFSMVHAAQSDRIIRQLRRHLDAEASRSEPRATA
jgi:hypothetical protein